MDLLIQFEKLQVNMIVTTDDETIRKAFEPLCFSTEQRLNTIQQIHKAGIQTAITMTPLPPLNDPIAFGDGLEQMGVRYFVVQQFHVGKTRFAAGTGDTARLLAVEMGWDDGAYQHTLGGLRATLPDVRESRDGFKPRFDSTKR